MQVKPINILKIVTIQRPWKKDFDLLQLSIPISDSNLIHSRMSRNVVSMASKLDGVVGLCCIMFDYYLEDRWWS